MISSISSFGSFNFHTGKALLVCHSQWRPAIFISSWQSALFETDISLAFKPSEKETIVFQSSIALPGPMLREGEYIKDTLAKHHGSNQPTQLLRQILPRRWTSPLQSTETLSFPSYSYCDKTGIILGVPKLSSWEGYTGFRIEPPCL